MTVTEIIREIVKIVPKYEKDLGILYTRFNKKKLEKKLDTMRKNQSKAETEGKRLEQLTFEPRRPLSLFVDDVEIFMGYISEIKHKFSRDEWMEMCKYKVVYDGSYFETRVVKLRSGLFDKEKVSVKERM